MSIFMSDHRKDQHGEGEHKIAELLVQVSVLCVAAPKVTWS